MLAGTLVVAHLTEIKVGAGSALETAAFDILLSTPVANNSSVLNSALAVDAFSAAMRASTLSIEAFAVIAMMDLGALGLSLDRTAVVTATRAIEASTVMTMHSIPDHTFIASIRGLGERCSQAHQQELCESVRDIVSVVFHVTDLFDATHLVLDWLVVASIEPSFLEDHNLGNFSLLPSKHDRARDCENRVHLSYFVEFVVTGAT